MEYKRERSVGLLVALCERDNGGYDDFEIEDKGPVLDIEAVELYAALHG